MAPDALMTDSHKSQLPILFIYFGSHLVGFFFPLVLQLLPYKLEQRPPEPRTGPDVALRHPDLMSLPPYCTSNCNVLKKWLFAEAALTTHKICAGTIHSFFVFFRGGQVLSRDQSNTQKEETKWSVTRVDR